MKRTAARAMIFLVSAGACSAAAPPPPPPVVTVAPVPADAGAAPLVNPAIVAVAAARAPRQLAVDGDLSEWGALPFPVPSVPRLPEEASLLPNPPEAASRLAVAVTGEAAIVAAELGGPAREGVWLGIGAHVPALPDLGQPGGRAGFVRLQCEYEVSCWEAGEYNDATACGPDANKPNPPEVVAECQKLLARHAELVEAHAKQFRRLFRIDRDGVRVLDPNGALVAVPGARHAWKPRAGGATMEVSLPLAALPRVAEAPLEALTLLGRAVDGAAPPEIPPDDWVRVVLPEPISFEPYGALRTEVFASQRKAEEKGPGAIIYYPDEVGHGLSYQPGDPLSIQYMSFGFEVTEVTPDERLLYQKRGVLGDVEVGDAEFGDADAHVAVWKGGRLVEVVPLPGTLRAAVTRGGELHVLAFGGFITRQTWSGVAVSPDGKHRDVVEAIKLRADRPDKKEQSYWSSVTSFESPDFETFGWRGSKTRRAVEVTWRWDPARRAYRATERAIPLPPKKPARPAKK